MKTKFINRKSNLLKLFIILISSLFFIQCTHDPYVGRDGVEMHIRFQDMLLEKLGVEEQELLVLNAITTKDI